MANFVKAFLTIQKCHQNARSILYVVINAFLHYVNRVAWTVLAFIAELQIRRGQVVTKLNKKAMFK